MNIEFDFNAMDEDVDATLKKGREEFLEKYKHVLAHLTGLSKADISKICPSVTDQQKYNELIAVVEEATKTNLAQAEFKQRIEKLGAATVKIAQKIPALAALLSV